MMQLNELANHHYLVSSGIVETKDDQAKIAVSLARDLGVVIRKGVEYLNSEVYQFIYTYLKKSIPQAFYKGFPQSVYSLTPTELLLDQLIHYYRTYGMGDFDKAGHSVFEEKVRKYALNHKDIQEHVFYVITENEAKSILAEIIEGYLASTRPLSTSAFSLVAEYFSESSKEVCTITNPEIASKNTVIKLILSSRNPILAKALSVTDYPKLVAELNYSNYGSKNVKKLNLNNKDRVFLTKILNILLNKDYTESVWLEIIEKRKVWKGILHHIHFKIDGSRYNHKALQSAVYDDNRVSMLSYIHKAIETHDIPLAVHFMESKGPNYIIRNMNYLISRSRTPEDIKSILNSLKKTTNPITLFQLRNYYAHLIRENKRTETVRAIPKIYRFNRFNTTVAHRQTNKEFKSSLTREIKTDTLQLIHDEISKIIPTLYKRKIGRVFIDKDMDLVAMPMQEGASNSGFNSLPQGSRTKLNDKNLRVFTYWERVNDVDLSAFSLDEDFNKKELSWRTMYANQGKAITFSGDQTSGYNGGSEFFDINRELFMSDNPDSRYIVFCDNIFTSYDSKIGGRPEFKDILCTAGFMIRSDLTRGKTYDPKTVSTQMTLTGKTSFCIMLAYDLVKNEIVWINMNVESGRSIAYSDSKFIDSIGTILDATTNLNVDSFYRMLATEVVEDPRIADVIISDDPEYETRELYEDKTIIHSYDIDKHLKYLNLKY